MTPITKPGIYDLPTDAYLADPVPGGSLSQSGAKLLLPPNTPAHFKQRMQNPPTPTVAFNFGHGAHTAVLGYGPPTVRIEAENWRTKAAREERDAVLANGGTPLLPDEYDATTAMASAIKTHPVAAKLLDPNNGKPEQSLFWQDGDVWRRGRLDWLPNATKGRLIVPDYKTADSAHEDKFQRSMDSYGYHQQAAWYLDGVRELLGADDAVFLFVVQEKTPPYLVNVIEPDPSAVKIGRYLNRKALDTFAWCQRTGRWPGYPTDVQRVRLPYYTESQFEGVLTAW